MLIHVAGLTPRPGNRPSSPDFVSEYIDCAIQQNDHGNISPSPREGPSSRDFALVTVNYRLSSLRRRKYLDEPEKEALIKPVQAPHATA